MQTFYEHTELFSTALVASLPKSVRPPTTIFLLIIWSSPPISAQTCSTGARVMAEKKSRSRTSGNFNLQNMWRLGNSRCFFCKRIKAHLVQLLECERTFLHRRLNITVQSLYLANYHRILLPYWQTGLFPPPIRLTASLKCESIAGNPCRYDCSPNRAPLRPMGRLPVKVNG